ncbi:MAG: GerMN domain-containing protein [Bacillota bacterium]|nr:GerMN domain-containing protein [Bacillota bacterium]
MRKRALLTVVMILVASLALTGCVQKSEFDKTVADLNAKIKAETDKVTKATADLTKAKADLDAATKQVASLQAIVNLLTKEVTIIGADGKPTKVRVTVEDKVEGLMENAIKAVLKTNAVPAGSKLEKLTLKADQVTVVFSKEFKTAWPKDVPAQKAAVRAVVNTLCEFPEVKKVLIQTAAGYVKIDKTTVSKALVKDDPLFK